MSERCAIVDTVNAVNEICIMKTQPLVISTRSHYCETMDSEYCLKAKRKKISKSNLHHTRGITPKHATSGGTHLRDLAPGLYSSEETSQRWRVVGDIVPVCRSDWPGNQTPDLSNRYAVRLVTELTAGGLKRPIRPCKLKA